MSASRRHHPTGPSSGLISPFITQSGYPSFLPLPQTPTRAASRTLIRVPSSPHSSRGQKWNTRNSRPTPTEYDAFLAQITKMWETQPHCTADDLAGIGTPTWIVDADHDEAIKRDSTLFMADHIPGSGLLIEPQVSHFAFLQDPQQFNADVLHFLEHLKGQ
jgi:pimeloyl-ACP methyl ester carboxylesterase